MKPGTLMNILHRLKSFCFASLAVVALLVVVSFSTSAQVTTASLTGRISDTQGGGVPGAVVSVTDQETGAVRSVNTEDDGNYEVLQLPVGAYSVKAEKA